MTDATPGAAGLVGGDLWILLAAILIVHFVLMIWVSAISHVRASDAQADPSGRIARVLTRSASYLEALRVGITLCTIAAGWLFGATLLSWPPRWMSVPVSPLLVAMILLLILGLTLFFSARLGHELGARWAIGWTRRTALLLHLGTVASAPVLWLFAGLSRVARRIAGGSPQGAASPRADEGDIRRMLASAEQSQLSDQKRELLDNIFELSERVARQVMVPRADVISLDVNQDVARNMQIARETGHTRFPLCNGDLDNILGFIHIKDLFRRGAPPEELLSMKREIFFVPETLPLEKLMRKMRSTHVHMAPIVDEYGNVSGIVTFENVLEEIVGEIQDEFDAERPELVRSSDGTFQVLGSMLIADLEDQLEVDLENDEDDTIGGVVLTAIGRSPEVGDQIQVGPLALEVLEIDVNRVRALRLRHTQAASLSAS